MRIALLPSAYAPSVGGVEVLTHQLAVSLGGEGHQVEVWTSRSSDDPLPQEEVIDGVRVQRFVFAAPKQSPRAVAAWPAAALRTLRELRRASQAFRPDLLHVQCFSNNGAYAALLSATTRTPLVVTLQGETFMDDHDIFDRSAFLRGSIRVALRRASAVTACSQFTLDDSIRRFGLAADKGRVIFNAVDAVRPHQAAVDIPFERYVLGLGRLVYRKGFDLLIAAWARAAAQFPDVGLVVAGGGEKLGELIEQTRVAGIQDRVYFPGVLSREQVSAVMGGAEIFVMPSRVEAFGIVALEAWQAGTPPIVTCYGGTKEFVENEVSGLVVAPDEIEALQRAVTRLLLDDGLRRRLREGGEHQRAAFDWSRATRCYEDVYRSVRDGGAAGRDGR